MEIDKGNFELKDRDGLARICILHTSHGTIDTPALMPVINPNINLFTASDLKSRFGAQIIITNSYLIKKSRNQDAIERGIHSLLDFDGPVMTDSGAFQSFTYGDVDIDPDEIVEFQEKIGVDIGTILDVPSSPDATVEKALDDMRITIDRARESIKHKKNMLLALTVQGSKYPDLRKKCAQELSKIGSDYYSIGGVVPLLETYRFKDLAEIIISSKQGLNPGVPVHLFGAGHPMVFPMAVLLGCDLFDSASYAKYAREGRMMFMDGTRHLDNLVTLPCDCPVCSSHSAKELQCSKDKERLIAEHNLYECFAAIRKIKQAIKDGTLWELFEMQARIHPSLLEALRIMKKYKEYLEQFEPLSRKRFFYTSVDSIHRPAVSRYSKRLFKNYAQKHSRLVVCFPQSNTPYHETWSGQIQKILDHTDARFVVESIFGAVPIELDEIYPVCQSIIPSEEFLDAETKDSIRHLMERFSHSLDTGFSICWEGDQTLDFIIHNIEKDESKQDQDLLRVKAVADYQFGTGASDALFNGKVTIIKSKNTDRIRNVIVDNEHILSIRAEDGFYTLKMAGGKRLHNVFSYPRLRVVINDDAVPFVLNGKNIFSRFIVDSDTELNPMDEVLVVNAKDRLIAIGRTFMTRDELLSFRSGVAVQIRESSGEIL